jgi:hypothetical protein
VNRLMRALLCATLFLSCVAPSIRADTVFVLTDLGALAGGRSAALNISPSGVVSGGYGTGGWGACLWKPGAGGPVFQSLGKPNQANFVGAWGVNDLGQVGATAGTWSSSFNVMSWENAFLWNGKWASMTSKTVQSEAMDINASGTLVGLYYKNGAGHPATMWQRGRQYILNGVPYSSGWASPALAVNDFGSVVGYHSGWLPFFWVPDKANGTTGTVRAIPGVSRGRAIGVSNGGAVVGENSVFQGPNGETYSAFYWDGVSGSAMEIGPVWTDPVTGQRVGRSTARKVNASGQVVGNCIPPNGTVQGFLWDSVLGFRELNSLPIQGGLPTGWSLTCDYNRNFLAVDVPQISINDAGQICGTATVTVNGVSEPRAFLLTPVTIP